MREMRLIDAVALIKTFEEAGLGEYSLIESVLAAGVYAGIDDAPAIDAVPVVHARWNPSPYNERRAKCSNCEVSRDIYTQIAWNYCPNCGAKMDGGAENG